MLAKTVACNSHNYASTLGSGLLLCIKLYLVVFFSFVSMMYVSTKLMIHQHEAFQMLKMTKQEIL